MSKQANEPSTERPPTVADTEPQKSLGRLRVPTAALRAYTMVFALVIIWLLFTWATGGIFLEARNFSNLMRQTAVTGVLAVGMLMIIVTGQIDLSVGSVVGLAGGVSVMVLTWLGWGLVPSVVASLIVGLVIGAFHGALVAYANIPAFIVTLGGLLAWRGAIKGLSQGNTVPIALRAYKDIGQSYVAPVIGIAVAVLAVAAIVWLNLRRVRARARYGLTVPSTVQTVLRIVLPSSVVVGFILALNAYAGVPIPVIILLAIALMGAFLMQNTTFGRYLYAIGGNPDAARLSGIALRRHILAVFCLMGALAGVAGVIYTARVGSASPDAGVLLELDAIAACVIGGASLMGGRGTIFGACLGALFMASLDNGMSLKNVPDFTQDIVKGSILVAAVGFDMLGRRKTG
ncbi:MAG TPA: sugar ABC transporter permease [Pyrinomonadaceae bacterium]|jgi:D-xylose transport system permease protein|nr:sugar ABC transporter permease [Pyrinomonadaceae bacterium]